MSKVHRRLAREMAYRIPPTRRYLEEKNKLLTQLEIQEKHIINLENSFKLKQHVLEERTNPKPLIRFIANQLDSTGAPLIFMDVMRDFIKEHPNANYDFTTFSPVDNRLVQELINLGIKVNVYERRDLEMVFTHGDVIVLNTVAHSPQLKNSIFEALEKGLARKLIWYMHEDWPQIFIVGEEKTRIRKLLDLNKIHIFLPAKKALANHREVYAGKKNTDLLPYRIRIPNKYYHQRAPADFNKLTFVMVGKTGEGLKGQLPILYAFLSFKRFYFDKNPKIYRDFELRFISIEEDYLSLQIMRHAPGLKKHYRQYPPLDHNKALDVLNESNVIICYSMRECLPIFVFEGMSMGHPILRNDVSGIDEQLKDGKNGFLLDSRNYQQVIDTIEGVLNKQKTSNLELARMSKVSNEIAVLQQQNSYKKLIDEAVDAYQ